MSNTFIFRLMGGMRLLFSIIWAGLTIVAGFYGDQVLRDVQIRLQDSLELADGNLTALNAMIEVTGDVLLTVQNSLDTVHQTTVDLSLTLTDTRPLVDDAAQVITQDIPIALDGVQASMPGVIETAAAVDETLIFLSAFQFTVPNPFGADLTLGLGIDYAPDVPLDIALESLSSNLEDIPGELRGLEDDFGNTSVNLLTLRDDLSALADDLYLINQQVDELYPQVDALAASVQQLHQSLSQIQTQLDAKIQKIWLGYLVLLGLIFISQIPAAYQGIVMIKEKK
ncbi:MAG: hypothetical protein HN413_10805 [Chloroflexi bacterium]|jgi:uncharacterized protein YoxC|nr:hypothetical protein [Chloroflexota bacterium]